MTGPGRDAVRLVVITVGDELLSGRVVDAHAAHVSAAVTALGVAVIGHRSVGDSPGALRLALSEEAARADVIVLAGGLGPTEDDRTRDECAAAAGVPLEWREEWWARIEERMRRHGVRISERNRRQAHFPAGSTPLENPYGSAPGFRLAVGDCTVWALPGVPDEFRGLVSDALLPSLVAALPAPPPPEEVWSFHGIPESTLDGWVIETLAASGHSPDHHICVRSGEIEVRHRAVGDLGETLARAASERFGSRFLGRGDRTLPERVIDEAVARGVRVATAESCTGGAVATRITDIPGSSAAFGSGWVVYADEAKESALGVARELRERHGAVSGPVAEALARGALERSGAGFAVSTTGIAGPSGGTEEKPVGTVWFGVAEAAPSGTIARSGVRLLRGDRARVRTLSVAQALASLLAAMRGEDPFPWTRS